jgi:predicted PurR-regulated permease PerM
LSLRKELAMTVTTVERLSKNNFQVNQALEVSIQIGLAALLVVGCLLILRPFIPLIMWGIIIAIASYPTFQKLQRVLRGRGGLAAVVWTLLLLAVLILPIFLLGQSLVEGIRPLAIRLKDGTLTVPPPPHNRTLANRRGPSGACLEHGFHQFD